MKRLWSILFWSLAAGFVACAVLTGVSYRAAAVRDARYELARLGLEDAARRVERGLHNLRTIRTMSDAVALTKARTFAHLLEADPDLLKPENRAQFDRLTDEMLVDELHVTDEKGTFVRCHPSVYEGMSLAGSRQSEVFLPAVTNRAFELAQTPQEKGLSTGDASRDGIFFQYAGVARRDKPGVVQIGHRADRVREATKMADVGEIASTMRVGRDGRVRIVPRADGDESDVPAFRQERDANGEARAVFATVCAQHLVEVSVPDPSGILARRGVANALAIADFILLLLMLLALPTVRTFLMRDLSDLRGLLSTRLGKSSSLLRTLTSPLSLATAALFLVVLAVLAAIFDNQALRTSHERLSAAAADMVGDMDDCVDDQLAFVGTELCQRYGSPEAMRELDLTKLMETYFVDEINVVDADGRCINSTVPSIRGADQWKKPNPAKYNQALIRDGQKVFSQPFRESATEKGVFRKFIGIAFPPPAKGYLQIGFDRARLADSVDYRLGAIASSWHIGENGFFIIAKKNGEILSCGKAHYVGQTLAGIGFDTSLADERQNEELRDTQSMEFLGFRNVRYFEARVGGEDCLCTSGTVNGFHRYVALIPLSQVYGPPRRSIVLTAVTLLVVFVVMLLFMTRLSNLVSSLRGFIAKDKAQRERDLTLAKTIQKSALPVVFPDTPQYRIFAQMDTAREVGGDFYDFFMLPTGRLMVLVADVSGKGVPAALFMMRAKAQIRAAATRHAQDLTAAVSEANDALAEANDAEMFVTAWIGLFDPQTGEIAYVNAGHNAPLVKRADGKVEWLRTRGGLALAAMAGVPYRAHRVTLAPGDSLFLYTDGVTEAMDGAGTQYGEERLERTLAASGSKFVTTVRHDVALFVGITEQSDDITMLALDFKSLH